MAQLLHLTEYRNVKNEIQEKKRIVNEQVSIFKSISTIFYFAMVIIALFILYLLCFMRAPELSGISATTLQTLSNQAAVRIPFDKAKCNDNDLHNLALEIEENETCLLKDPYMPSEKFFSSSNVISVSPPRVTYKGYYFDVTSKTAIIEIADSNTQIFVKEKQKFYSGTALLIKIKKEEIIWRWHGNLYVTKIG